MYGGVLVIADAPSCPRESVGSNAGECGDSPVEGFIVVRIFSVNAVRVVASQLPANIAVNVCFGKPRRKGVAQAME